jgi:hypothetical protein
MLQGINAADAAGWKGVYSRVASALDSKLPNVSFDELVQSIEQFEAAYHGQAAPQRTNWPLIKINHPSPFDVVTSPVHVAGYSTSFEGSIVVRVRDSNGFELGKAFTSGGGNGHIGEFKADVHITDGTFSDRGVVEVFEISQRDGSEQNLTAVMVLLDGSFRPF